MTQTDCLLLIEFLIVVIYLTEELSKMSTNSRNKKRKVTGQSSITQFNVETLVVTDYSLYLDHQRYANSTNQDLVLVHMRIYFSHVFNGVNQRFLNTFEFDQDMRLSIVIKGFLIQTVCL